MHFLTSFFVNLNSCLITIDTNNFTYKFSVTNTNLSFKIDFCVLVNNAEKMMLSKGNLPTRTWQSHACFQRRRLFKKDTIFSFKGHSEKEMKKNTLPGPETEKMEPKSDSRSWSLILGKSFCAFSRAPA